MSVLNTGVWLKGNELEKIRRQAHEAAYVPVVIVAPGTIDAATIAREALQKRVNELAIETGLPDMGKTADGEPINYGISEGGEFLGWKTREERMAEAALLSKMRGLK